MKFAGSSGNFIGIPGTWPEIRKDCPEFLVSDRESRKIGRNSKEMNGIPGNLVGNPANMPEFREKTTAGIRGKLAGQNCQNSGNMAGIRGESAGILRKSAGILGHLIGILGKWLELRESQPEFWENGLLEIWPEFWEIRLEFPDI